MGDKWQVSGVECRGAKRVSPPAHRAAEELLRTMSLFAAELRELYLER
jgi:hypothetical protein